LWKLSSKNRVVAGSFTSRGQTNGLYARSPSFKTKRRPIATLTLMSGILPTKVATSIILGQQKSWRQRYTTEVAVELAAGAPFPDDVHPDDRVTHPDHGRRFIMPVRPWDLQYFKIEGDLPVYKELRGRIYGMRAIIASAQTFDPKESPVDNDGVPVNDASRYVNDAIMHAWGSMCDEIRQRKGRHRLGEKKWLDGKMKKISGLHPKIPDFHPFPVAWMATAPDGPHAVDLNSGVHTLWFLKEEIKAFDKHFVSLFAFFPLVLCHVSALR